MKPDALTNPASADTIKCRTNWTLYGRPPMPSSTATSWGEQLEIIAPVVSDYLLTHCTPPDDVLRDLSARTREATGDAAGMQVSPDEGALLTMLTRLTGARFAVEVGVFTGYSSICIARGLAVGGRLLACDTSPGWTAAARRYWERAGG